MVLTVITAALIKRWCRESKKKERSAVRKSARRFKASQTSRCSWMHWLDSPLCFEDMLTRGGSWCAFAQMRWAFWRINPRITVQARDVPNETSCFFSSWSGAVEVCDALRGFTRSAKCGANSLQKQLQSAVWFFLSVCVFWMNWLFVILNYLFVVWTLLIISISDRRDSKTNFQSSSVA